LGDEVDDFSWCRVVTDTRTSLHNDVFDRA
jgi:hypothetical protein